MKRVINYRVIPLILAGIILGVCSITYLDRALIIACAVGAAILALSAVFVKQMKKARGKLLAVLLAFCISMGITALSYASVERNAVYERDAVITARIDILSETDSEGVVEGGDGRIEVVLEDIEIDGVKYSGKAQAVFSDDTFIGGCAVGDVIKFKGDVSPLALDTEDSYSVADYTDGIYYHVYSYTPSDPEEAVFEKLGNEATVADKIRLRIKSVLYSNVKSDTAGFLYAMTFGDKSGLTYEVKDAFSYTGTAHIFAVSGLHVGVIAGAIIFLLRRFKLRNDIATFCIVAALLLPFCALCEFSPSTVRATVMILLHLLSKVFMMRSDAMTNFSLAACILLIANPINLFDLGFVMSFAAVFGLITLAKPLQTGLRKIKCPSFIATGLGATLSVNIALLPVLLVYFGGQSLLFVVANLIVIPLVSVLFPIYLFIAFTAAILSFTGFLLTAIGMPFTLIIYIVTEIGGWNFLILDLEISKAFIALNFLFILILSEYVHIPDKAKKIAASVAGAAVIAGVIFNMNLRFEDEIYLRGFTDSSGCQIVFIDDAKRGGYLIVNGEADYTACTQIRDIMRDEHIRNIDGVFVVGECSNESISDIMLYSNCTKLYSFAPNEYAYTGYAYDSIVVGDDYMLGYYYKGLLEIILGGVNIKVLADGYTLNKIDDTYDILICYDSVGELVDGRYAVCEEGYVNSLKNYVSSAFTIRIKDDRIITNNLRG